MKDEDTDWMIYHLIAAEKFTTLPALSEKSGLDSAALERSLDRLEKVFMINRCEGKIRVMGVGETLLSCQAKYSDDMPFVIENGIVREKKR